MILFKADNNQVISDVDFRKSLEKFNLSGKSVILFSRLFSFGRIQGENAVQKIVEIVQECIGEHGSLSIPSYTFSGYKDLVFDVNKSKCVVGVLGEFSRHLPGFIRTTHPIYSHNCWGKHNDILIKQKYTTCFGKNSFYDLFSGLPEPYILVLGAGLNTITNVHYYDQKFSAHSRFLKKFIAKIRVNGVINELEFDSFVRKENIYKDKVPCLANLDALATDLKIIKRSKLGENWLHGINEKDFQKIYQTCLNQDPEYYLYSSKETCLEYSEKNIFDIFHGSLAPQKIEKIKFLLK